MAGWGGDANDMMTSSLLELTLIAEGVSHASHEVNDTSISVV